MPTSWTQASRPWPTSWEWRTQPASIYLMTQLLDFLMTQDDNYIVLQNSSESVIWEGRPLI